MREEFLEEHRFEEEVIRQEEHNAFLGIQTDKSEQFKMILKSKIFNTVDERELIQLVVMSALETEGLHLRSPEVIVEAVMVNPEMRAEAIRFTEDIMKDNVQ